MAKNILVPYDFTSFGVIAFEKAVEILGKNVAEEVQRISLQIYEFGRDLAAEKGIIVADTNSSSSKPELISLISLPEKSRPIGLLIV